MSDNAFYDESSKVNLSCGHVGKGGGGGGGGVIMCHVKSALPNIFPRPFAFDLFLSFLSLGK